MPLLQPAMNEPARGRARPRPRPGPAARRPGFPEAPLGGPGGHAAPGTLAALCKVPRGAGPGSASRAGQGGGRPRSAAAPAEPPASPGVGGAARPGPASGVGGAGRVVGPAGARRRGRPGRGGSRAARWPAAQAPVPAHYPGAARPHSPPAPRAPLRSPRWRARSSSRHGRGGPGALGAEGSPHPDRRPPGPRRRAARPPGTEPPRRRCAALCPCGRGGERRGAASTRFPGPAARGANPREHARSGGRAWVLRRALRPALGSARGSAPRHSRLRLQTSTPCPPAIFSSALPRCLFHGTRASDGDPDG